MTTIKGYKATDKDGKCRGFQFKVGKTYTSDKELSLCSSGFHYCANLFDVYSYYPKHEDTRLFEIEAIGEVKTEGDKSATNKIKIVRELTEKELLKAWINRTNSGDWNSGDWNSGDGNSGNRNSGDWNSGYGNSGNRNSGNWNSGYGNSGNRNSGNRNSGDWNSGDWNSGDWNSGYGNSGNRNSGDWNSGDGNSGYFNTEIPLYFFNKPSTMPYTEELAQKIRSINVLPILSWIYSEDMTEEEKTNSPGHKTTGGFLRSTGRYNWSKLTDQDKEFIKGLPNFDDEVFAKISGIRLMEPKTIKIIHDGQEFEINMEKAKELGLVKKK